MKLQSYAKLNLGLLVLNVREDGYHNLFTLFQRISLADSLDLEPLDGEIKYNGPSLTESFEQNLCVKAAKQFQKQLGSSFGVNIVLDKKIPVGSGLGGGSSNAASVILGMKQLYNLDLSLKEIIELGAKVGSDVPFFLLGTSAAIGEGRGELLEPVSSLPEHYSILILFKGIPISTSEAYKKLDQHLNTVSKSDILRNRDLTRYDGKRLPAQLVNNFEFVVFDEHPILLKARDGLIKAGAIHAGLSGSGSAIFGIFEELNKAKEAQFQFDGSWSSFICRSC